MYSISQCHSYCSSINVPNIHQKIIPSSRDCCRKGQKNKRQGSRLEHTYAYIYKVIEMTGLCLIISFIHASGKGETRRCQADGRSWDKIATKGAGKRNQAEQGKWGQGEETMSEWVQPKTLRVKKKYKCKAETTGSRGVQERPVRCFDSSILRQELHTPPASHTPLVGPMSWPEWHQLKRHSSLSLWLMHHFNYTGCAGPGLVVPIGLAAQLRASEDNRGVPGEPLQPLALAPAPA